MAIRAGTCVGTFFRAQSGMINQNGLRVHMCQGRVTNGGTALGKPSRLPKLRSAHQVERLQLRIAASQTIK